jgi:hypothetical protein
MHCLHRQKERSNGCSEHKGLFGKKQADFVFLSVVIKRWCVITDLLVIVLLYIMHVRVNKR